uniref:Uncharacterized protein n=1 Tax=Pygocentrus nattereri TaxID=42514 RepID=A0AAR2L0M3_PYGNA
MEVAGIYERDCFTLHPGNTYEDAYRHLADGSMTKLGISEHEKAIDISIYVDAPFLQHYQQHQPPLNHTECEQMQMFWGLVYYSDRAEIFMGTTKGLDEKIMRQIPP